MPDSSAKAELLSEMRSQPTWWYGEWTLTSAHQALQKQVREEIAESMHARSFWQPLRCFEASMLGLMVRKVWI